MKGTVIYIVLALLAIFYLSSCVSSKEKLNRAIVNHGVPQSIAHIQDEYAPYFITKDTIIHDTTIIERKVEVPVIDTTVILSDSSNFWHYKSDSLSLIIDKLTGRLKMNIKPRTVYVKDTVSVFVKCPEIKCPDCEDLQDNTKAKGFNWLWIIIGGVILAAFYIWVNRTK